MMIGATFFIIAALIVGIWLIIEFKRLKHKLFAIALIMLILVAYIGFTISLSDQEIIWSSPRSILSAGKIYFSWMGGIFGKMKSITAYALKLDWKEVPDSKNETMPLKVEIENGTESEIPKTNETEINKTKITEKIEDTYDKAKDVWDTL